MRRTKNGRTDFHNAKPAPMMVLLLEDVHNSRLKELVFVVALAVDGNVCRV